MGRKMVWLMLFGLAGMMGFGRISSLTHAQPSLLTFAGYTWEVRSGFGGPGPNYWEPANVWVDEQGHLHLRLDYQAGQWRCAEVTMTNRLGFGRYQFWVEGALNTLDPQVVLGLFDYPPSDVGPDGTNEIDIEFARWGHAANPPGNYTVWPAQVGLTQRTYAFDFTLAGTYTTQRFTRQSQSVRFQSLHGHRDDNANQFAGWLFRPRDPLRRIPQAPLPVHLNLWLFQGQPPQNGQSVEIVIHAFTFTPALTDTLRRR